MRTKSLLTSLAFVSICIGSALTGCSSATDADVGSTSEAIGRCGIMPKAPPCNTLVCTADGWDLEPIAAGVACHTLGGVAGKCDGDGSCLPPAHTGKAFPSYYVLALLYNAPGAMSEVDYGQQGTIGSEVDIQNLFKAGVQVQVSGHIAGVGTQVQVGFAGGPVDGNSWEISKTQSSTLSLTSQQDALSHAGDTFFLWTNAELDLSQVGNGPVQTALTSRGGAAPIIVPVTVAELKNPSTLPAWKANYLAALTPADYKAILGLDPLVPTSIISVFGQPTPDPARYTKITQLQLVGPDHPGDPIPGTGIGITNEQTNGTVNGYNTATTASIMFDTGFDLFGVLGTDVQAGATFEWDYQKTTQSKQGTAQSATVTLKTGTVGYHDVIDVYYDTLFNSFAFAHPPLVLTGGVSTVGTARSTNGAPIANRPVTITFADGQKRTVVTDGQGVYRVIDAPAAVATVSALSE